MSIIFEDLGRPLAQQKIVPGNTATGLSANCIKYTRWKLNFDDGDTELTVGSWIVGATSGAVAKIVSVHADSASWTNNTGYVIVDSWNGIAFQDNEEIKQGATATAANVDGVLKQWQADYENKGMDAKAILVCALDQTALVNICGGTPDQTQLNGIPLPANSSIVIKNVNAIKAFKVIDRVAASASTVQVTFYF